MSNEELDRWIDENKEVFFKKFNLPEQAFTFSNLDILDKQLGQSALFETIRETYQAAEGLYHNLNTLQSRSGNQLN